MKLSIDEIKKLQQKKYRQEFGAFLVEGEHLLLELDKAARHNPALQASELYVTESHRNFSCGFPARIISEKNMALISDTKTPQGMVAVVTFSALRPAAPTRVSEERAIYLYEIQDPGNLGSILRTLAWFGGFRCLLSPGSVDPYNPKVVRASMGAIFHVPLELECELESLPERFEGIAALDMQGSALSEASFKSQECFLFGNEARGVPREQLQTLNAKPYTIAGSGAIESLNLATAVNMCVYELNRPIASDSAR